jgi:hypothetical protein
MMKKVLVLLVVLATTSMAHAIFDPGLDILVNGNPWDGGSVAPSDMITVIFVDTGGEAAPGSFSVYNMDAGPAEYMADSFQYYLPAGLLGGSLQLADLGTSVNVSGGALFGPATPMPEGGVLWEYTFHVPDDLQESDIIDIAQSGAYGGVDLTQIDDALVRLHVTPEPMTIGLLGLGALGLLRRRK